MKNLIYIVLAMLLLVSLAFGQEVKDDSGNSRFSGRIEAGVVYGSSNSQLIAIDAENFTIEELDSEIDDLSKNNNNLTFAAPIVLFDINYAIRDDLLIYFGSPFFDDYRAGLSLGIEKLFANESVLDVALFVNSDEVWEDPYVLNVEREIADTKYFGLNINLSEIMGTNFSFNYTGSVFSTDNDVSGDNNSLLKRRGFQNLIKPGYTIFLDDLQTMALTPSLLYEKNSSEGDALSYDKYGAELSFNYEKDNNNLILSAGTEIKDYDAVHPEFDKRINETCHSGELFYTRSNLMDSNWYMRVGGGLSYSKSNADFFEHLLFLSGITIGYSFD